MHGGDYQVTLRWCLGCVIRGCLTLSGFRALLSGWSVLRPDLFCIQPRVQKQGCQCPGRRGGTGGWVLTIENVYFGQVCLFGGASLPSAAPGTPPPGSFGGSLSTELSSAPARRAKGLLVRLLVNPVSASGHPRPQRPSLLPMSESLWGFAVQIRLLLGFPHCQLKFQLHGSAKPVAPQPSAFYLPKCCCCCFLSHSFCLYGLMSLQSTPLLSF